MYKIDKSAFTAEELKTWNQLVAKAKVDPEAAAESMEEDIPPMPKKKPEIDMEQDDEMEKGCGGKMKKSADPELAELKARYEALEKSVEMKEFTNIAKKYADLGYKTEELAEKLYNMKKSNSETYNDYVDILEKSLKLQNESGVFAEIGKSGAQGGAPVGAQAKADAKAREIMKSDPAISYQAAIAKAWDENPELMAEYDREYMG